MKCLALTLVIGLSSFALQAAPPDSVLKDWNKHCVSCHGKDGKGRTRAGRMAKVKDLTDAKYQASFTDEEAFKSIKNGLEIDGREAMKPFNDKIADEDIKKLVEFVRTLKKD